MSHNPDVIVGAGLAGLIAAHAWPRTALVEAAPEPRETHRALLRFRDDSVSNLTGIEFKKVSVRKGIWSEGRFVAPDIRLANLYARKVLGSIGAGERSIWNIDPVQRFIAPPDFYDRLLDSVGPRVSWNERFDFTTIGSGFRTLSTAPLPVMLSRLGISHGLRFESASITVDRFEFEGVDLYQTVYFPDATTNVYRASFTGATLIVERAFNSNSVFAASLGAEDVPGEVYDAFGLAAGATPLVPKSGARVGQRYGKIAPVHETVRKQLLFKLTHEHGIYSLGRFATWRNVLLDDLIGDIVVVKRLLAMSDATYDLRKSL